jgi:hypothetical protein
VRATLRAALSGSNGRLGEVGFHLIEGRDTMKEHLAALAAMLVVATPTVACANDLGGLAYVVFIWPIGLILLLASIILGAIGLRFLKRTNAEHPRRAFAVALIVAGCLFGLAYPLAAFGLDSAYDAGAPLELALVAVIPVEIATLLLCILGWRLWMKGSRGVPPSV